MGNKEGNRLKSRAQMQVTPVGFLCGVKMLICWNQINLYLDFHPDSR